ncbi:hypothetical protein ACGF5C_04450 [Micromonospora sp. NPDC047620]|uniref:hypothetical protein n=1 Tax=Micromonospora sp. NPDC047620 TaxID=3364251 RepID=UPI0037125333
MIDQLSTLAAIAESSPTKQPSALENAIAVLFLLAFGGFMLRRWAINNGQASEALARAKNLDHNERDKIEREILDAAYRAKNQSMRINELAISIGEHQRLVLHLVRPMVKWGLLEALPLADGTPDVDLNEYSKVAISAAGDKRLRERDPVVKKTYHGDYFHVGDNSTGVNKSRVVNSHIGTYQERYDGETVAALKELERVVRESGNDDAIETLDGFLSEARSDKPSRARMRLLFSGVQQLVPTISGMTDLVAKVTAIFS